MHIGHSHRSQHIAHRHCQHRHSTHSQHDWVSTQTQSAHRHSQHTDRDVSMVTSWAQRVDRNALKRQFMELATLWKRRHVMCTYIGTVGTYTVYITDWSGSVSHSLWSAPLHRSGVLMVSHFWHKTKGKDAEVGGCPFESEVTDTATRKKKR